MKKKLHKALRSVQVFASFISFYFEILSYLACVEKIIRLAFKNSVKNQLVISSLSEMLQDTLFLLSRYICHMTSYLRCQQEKTKVNGVPKWRQFSTLKI